MNSAKKLAQALKWRPMAQYGLLEKEDWHPSFGKDWQMDVPAAKARLMVRAKEMVLSVGGTMKRKQWTHLPFSYERWDKGDMLAASTYVGLKWEM